MKAIIWNNPRDIEVTEIDPPTLNNDDEAIVKVTLTAICGTDLHPYRGNIPDFSTGTILGHEFTGIVEQVGKNVNNFKPGDRVVVSDLVACGDCWYCRSDMHYHCKSASLFGYGEVVGGNYTPGAQAEKVRVPFADTVMAKIPDGILDEEIIFVGDILATGYGGVEESNLQKGDTVVIIGGGPVGLMAALSAKVKSPSKIFIIEKSKKRFDFIKKMGFYPVFPNEVEEIFKHTNDRGPDVVIEAVGTNEALNQALNIVRPNGNIVCLGSHHSKNMPFNTENAFAKEIKLKFVVGNPIKHFNSLIELIKQRKIQPQVIISHQMDLSKGVEGYKLFDKQEAIKVVLKP